MANAIRGVLYLERDKFQLSIDNRVDVLSYVFPQTLVNNLDILDIDGLKLNLNEFIKKSSISMTSLIIVLSSSVMFEQDFKTEDELKIQQFLDNVPYETISIKKIPIAGGTKVLVGNATFYTLLADVFKQNGTKLDFVIPEQALGANIGAFNASTARLILTQFEALSQYKFIVDASTEDKVEYKPPEKHVVVHKKNYTLLYTLPVFILLILVLAFMIFQPILFAEKNTTKTLAAGVPTLAPAYVPKNVKATDIPQASSSASISPSLSITPSTTVVFRKISSVQIIYDPSSAQKADQLRTTFSALGITNIQVNPVSSDVTAPIVLFSSSINPVDKQKVFDEIKKVLPNSTSQDSTTQPVDVSITIGKTK